MAEKSLRLRIKQHSQKIQVRRAYSQQQIKIQVRRVLKKGAERAFFMRQIKLLLSVFSMVLFLPLFAQVLL